MSNSETQLAQLSKRKFETVALIVEEKTSKEIAIELFLSQSTIETHRKNIFKKLKVKSIIGLYQRKQWQNK